jgi:hypothetical protein
MFRWLNTQGFLGNNSYPDSRQMLHTALASGHLETRGIVGRQTAQAAEPQGTSSRRYASSGMSASVRMRRRSRYACQACRSSIRQGITSHSARHEPRLDIAICAAVSSSNLCSVLQVLCVLLAMSLAASGPFDQLEFLL